jgi:hypothetical protein
MVSEKGDTMDKSHGGFQMVSPFFALVVETIRRGDGMPRPYSRIEAAMFDATTLT